MPSIKCHMLFQTVTPIVEQHQTARKLVTDEVLDKYFEIRALKFGS